MPRPRPVPGQRSPRLSSARLEQEQLTSAVACVLEATRRDGRATHALLVVDLDGFTRVQ